MQNSLFIGTTLVALSLTNTLLPVNTIGDYPQNTVIRHTVAKATTYTVDPAQSTISWNAKKVTGEHNGVVKIAKGQLSMDGNKLTGGTFVADMTTMRDVDKGEANPFNERLVNHLRSEDFFGVEKFPTSTFKITSVKPIDGTRAGEPNYTVSGELTIKNMTKPQTFPATVTLSGNVAQATAKLTINRIDYDIKYRAAIIGTAADKIIDDTFALDLKMVATKTPL
ncbi:YceI family protein [Spirosoma endophyticum]|uniref:Polyisoprenoid-binding protein YceI n=1 Tax=Spirosoma endophyticum TaxID=662367 RepID=A0A1I1SUD7_9BACT|nr:YceI family protein [Spirosoma endophyticum]SFD48358.1 Polyisoprenoid-binding protein YceI [Spirosoma endophyticum]